MAAQRRKKQIQDDTLIDLSQAKVTATHFFERYQKIILGGLAGIALIVGGYLVYRYVIVEPKQKEAVEQMFQAQLQFEKDSFDLALNNPGGGYSGFLDIIDQYGATPAGNSARLYAGLAYLNMGNFDEAVNYLSDFDPTDDITSAMKLGALGDAYAELNDMDKALSHYNKAATAGDNSLTTPYYLLKVGQLSEKEGNVAEARKAYEKIKNEYPQTEEGQEIEKYLARLDAADNKG
jgi:tetratricopeptide (TPR) repeat protein